MNRNLSGIYSGICATGPMTLFMAEVFKRLPSDEKSPLPPASLSYQLAQRVTGVAKELSPEMQSVLGFTSHFVYGAAAGVLYSQTVGRIKRPALEKGLAFGAAFWAANYLVVTPALNMRASAPKMPASRNAMMFAAHLLWGAALGLGEESFRKQGQAMWTGEQKARAAE